MLDVLALAHGHDDGLAVGEDENGAPYGLLRCGYVEETALDSFLTHVKEMLGTPVLRFARGTDRVRKVAVGGGACAGAMHLAKAAGCDTFVTADVKYNQFWDARDLGMNLIDAGHFYTENPVCAYIAEKLTRHFPDLVVEISQNHADCMEFA